MLRSRSPPCWSCRSFFNLPSSSAATPFEGTKIVTSGEAYSPPQQPRRRPRAGRLFFESSSRSIFLFEHDLFGKPVPTHRVVARGHAFPDHALEIALLDPAMPTMAFTFMQHSAGRALNCLPAIAQFPPCSGLPRDAASVFIRGLAFGRLHAGRPRECFRDA